MVGEQAFWIGLLVGLLAGGAVARAVQIRLANRLSVAVYDERTCLEARMSDAFASLSAEALKESKEDLLQLAGVIFDGKREQMHHAFDSRLLAVQDLIKPLGEALQKLGAHSQELERKRASAYDLLQEHIKRMLQEASQLSNALRRPGVRGSWGELTLQTICENAGLLPGEHFILQDSVEDEDGILRPDMVIKLPQSRVVIVDSKTPLDSFRDALAAEDEATRCLKLKAHAKSMRDHMKRLSAKAYWSRYSASPDCTVMFVPTEAAYAAAIETDPALIQDAANQRVVLANPMTLVSIVRAIAHVLNDERARESTEEIRVIGRKVYDSLRACASHIAKVGKHLRQSVDAYNVLVTGYESSVLPRASRLRELGASSGDAALPPEQVAALPRALDARQGE